jgi:hypothetical protein
MSEYNIIQDGHAEYDGTSSISGGDTFQTDFSLSPSYPLGTSDVNQKKYYFKTKIKVIDAADKIYDIDVFQVNQDGSDEIKIGDYNTKTKKVVMNGNAPGNSLFNYGGWLKNKNNNRILSNIVQKQVNSDPNFVGEKGLVNELESEPVITTDEKKFAPAKPKARQSYETDLCYPVTLRRGSQDRLQIDVRQLQNRRLRNAQSLSISDRNLGKSIGRVFLPIPAGIQDFNGVSFQSGSLNPIELAAAQTALTGVTSGLEALTDEVSSLVRGALGTRGRTADLREAIATYFVGQATGIGARGIFTRTENAVVNPNLELLFTGPTLRPFNFTFKMSPRDKGESIVVKKIIRLFKQSSAVQTTPSGLFLKSPDAYTIKYLTKGSRSIGSATTPEGLDSFDDTHDFLPKIKNCALLNCSVNYTPDGSYMTYENTSPVSYTMTLRFQELEPIFNDDYTNLDGDSDDSVGF